ncbi:MAG TPA: outer membrane protein assembly factor BamE [Gammaproteobacteria bacterium]|nr:outer membrane protein assembly factor BamE [Gammaproteobacteria bacterium]
MRNVPTALCLLVPLTVTGCNYTKIPTPADLPIVYKIDVQQGNVVTQDMLAKLQPGMDKSKARFIMGTPLVVDVFHQNRWDYLYTLQERGGEIKQRRVSLFFKDDKLDHIEGDVKPASGEIAVQERRSDTVNVPEQEKTLLARMKDKMGGSDKKQETAAAAETKTPAAGGPSAPAETATAEAASKSTPANTAVAAESGSGARTSANPAESEIKTQTAASDKTVAAKTTEVTIPEDAPRPPEKSFFRKLLEKVGVGDNEGGSYEPSDPRYKDPTNPDTSPTASH